MKIIEIEDEMYEFLMNLSKELNTQDHRGTAMPYFFQIQTKEKVAAPDEIATVQPKVEESKAPTTAPAPIKNLNPNSQSFVPKAKNPIPSDIKNSLPSTLSWS